VLLINLTPTVTELARHLVLSGINIKLVDTIPGITVTQTDPEVDFLFTA